MTDPDDRVEQILRYIDQARGSWLTVRRAATYSSPLWQCTVRRLLESGKLTGYRPVERRVLIDRRELDSLIQWSGP